MRVIFFTLIFYGASVIAAQKQPYDAIINLGGDCQPAYQMHMHGIRYYALPFDKLITPFPALQNLLENTFDQFLEAENLELKSSGKERYILDTRYDVRLLHDFPIQEDFLQEYESIKALYDRRITRFFTLIAESKRPLFIRKKITRAEAATLAATLRMLCKHKNFTLLVLDGAEEAKEDWCIDNVKNMHLKQPNPYVWKGDAAAWREVLSAVGLILTTKEDSVSEV